MSLFQRYFSNQFTSKEYSLSELRKFGGQMLQNLIADAPTGFSTVIADFTTCQTSFDATFPNVLGSKGARAEAVANKNLFRKALAAKIAKIANGIGAAYGQPSAELDGAFPEGRSIFTSAEDADLGGKLQALKDWFTPAHVTAVGAAHQTSINGLVTQWTALWAALGGAKGALASDVGDQKEVKATYQGCLFTVVLSLAIKFPEDEAKYQQYVPEHLLEDAGSRPEAPELEGSFDGGALQAAFTKSGGDGATSFRLERRDNGTGDFNDNGPVDADSFTRGDLAPGSYEFRLVAINEVGETVSNVVTIVVP